MSNFITLTKSEFEKILPENFKVVENNYAKEFIYEIPTTREEITVRIYSTVDVRTNQTRESGTDAIRIVFWDIVNDRPIGKGKRINRVEKKTSIHERITARINEFMASAGEQNIIDFEYVKRVLMANSWADFAVSLLDQLNERGNLSDKQLAYILGSTNPRGKKTFEQIAKDKGVDLNAFETEEEGQDEEQKKPNQKRKQEEPEENEKNNTPTEGDWRAPEVKFDGELIDTTEHKYFQYPFKKFNPVQSEVYPCIANDNNMVCSAQTSSGKTICAELIMDYVINDLGKRVMYLSPLKSLTREKYDDWSKRYNDEKITIMTGDYTLTDKQKEKLDESKIIVLTSEMCDSRTRKMQSEGNYWLKDVGLVIVDEAHILTTSRGHAVETGIMRFTKINPDARIVFLSATMPNVAQLGNWLTKLNGKETDVIYNTWRPVELQMHYQEYEVAVSSTGRMDYWDTQENKRSMAVETAMSKPNEKFLIFVHDKGTGRDLVKRFEDADEKAIFHNADLNLKDRLEIENSFRDRENGLRVMVSTSTTAWGVNLPARNVIIVGIHRGINEVDELDIIQMCGRAGRYGIDDEGHVYMVIPAGSTANWQHTFANPRPVVSILNNRGILGFHTCAEVNNKEITSVATLFNWYSRSLAYMQNIVPFEKEDASALIEELSGMEMIGGNEHQMHITDLGKVSAWLYYTPYDIYGWYSNFSSIYNSDIEANDLLISWALTDIPSNDMGYLPKDAKGICQEIKMDLRGYGIQASDAVISTAACTKALEGEKATGSLAAAQRSLTYDIERMMSAISLIDKKYAEWGVENFWKVLPIRIKYGVPEEIVPLTKIAGVGGKRAKKLWEKGFRNLNDIASNDRKKELLRLFNPTMTGKIQKSAKSLLKMEKHG